MSLPQARSVPHTGQGNVPAGSAARFVLMPKKIIATLAAEAAVEFRAGVVR